VCVARLSRWQRRLHVADGARASVDEFVTIVEDVRESIDEIQNQTRRFKDRRRVVEKAIGANEEQFWSRFARVVLTQPLVASEGDAASVLPPASSSSSSSSLSSSSARSAPRSGVGSGAGVLGGAGRGVSGGVSGAGVSRGVSSSAINSSVSQDSTVASARRANSEEEKSSGRNVQHKLTTVVEAGRYEALVHRVGVAGGGARIVQCSKPGAGLWKVVRPLEPALTMSEAVTKCALRHQYGVSRIGAAGDVWYCKCGDVMTAGHAHACNRVSGPATFERHESIITELCAVAEAYVHVRCAREPRLPYAERAAARDLRKARGVVVPDILFDGADLSLATDVSVVYAGAASYLPSEEKGVRGAAAAVDKALAERARDKRRLYVESCKAMDAEFEPFVVESHGFMHSSASKVVARLARHCAEVVGGRETEMRGYITRRVAVALQRGNAMLERTARQASRGSYGAAVARGMVAANLYGGDSDSSHLRRSRRGKRARASGGVRAAL